jgi:hypothetical protein
MSVHQYRQARDRLTWINAGDSIVWDKLPIQMRPYEAKNGMDSSIPIFLPLQCSFQHAKVVLVDDDLAVLSSLQFLLELEGFGVITFKNGPELLSQTVLPSRGCFVIDYSLPFMNPVTVIDDELCAAALCGRYAHRLYRDSIGCGATDQSGGRGAVTRTGSAL